jgi:hypothetical protein
MCFETRRRGNMDEVHLPFSAPSNKISNIRSAHKMSRLKFLTTWISNMACYADSTKYTFFYVHGSVHRESMSIRVIVQQDATIYSLLYFCKLLYMFRVVTPSIARSTYNCNYSIQIRSKNAQVKTQLVHYTTSCFDLWIFTPYLYTSNTKGMNHLKVTTASGTGQTVCATLCYGGDAGTAFQLLHDSGT